jgi:hypothetical protein
MKIYIFTPVFLLLTLLSFTSIAEVESEEEEEAVISAYLRVWCALAPDQEAKEPGYRVPFKNKHSLLLIPEKSEPVVIYNQIMPFMARGYTSASLGRGKLGLYEIVKNSAGVAENRLLAQDSVNMENGKFYTVAIWFDGSQIQLKAWEDLPAILPPPTPDSNAPLPSRALRVYNLAPKTRALISCKEAGVNLPVNEGAWPTITNIKPGNWNFDIQGITEKTDFKTTKDLDFTEPANYSMVLIENVYQKTSIRLFQDATIPSE